MENVITSFDLEQYTNGIITNNLSAIISNIISKLPVGLRDETRKLRFGLRRVKDLDTRYSSTFILHFINASHEVKNAMKTIYPFITVYYE